MRRVIAVAGLLAVLGACGGGDGPTEPRSVEGTYALKTWNGAALPALRSQDILGTQFYIVRGRIVIEGFQYTLFFTERETQGSTVIDENEWVEVEGTYSVLGEQTTQGRRIRFDISNGGSFEGVLTINGRTLDVPTYFSQHLVFER